MSQISIATVDYNDFVSGNPEKRAAFIKKLGDAFAEIGFAIVANHGVSIDLKNNLFDTTKSFFALDDTTKQKYEDTAIAGQRGYIAKNKESAKGRSTPDLKEYYHIGQEVTDGDPIKDEYPDNIWADEVPELEEYGLEVYRTLENTGGNLLCAIALYLELEEDYFDKKIHNGNSILRLLHYYPIEDISNVPKDAVRAAAHEDINLITLLMGASAKGLQAKTLEGKWIDVSPEPNQIVINMGDMLQRLTNGKLRSTSHQVICPDPELLKTARYSMPFFLHPRSNMDLTCLPSTVDTAHPKQFSDMTAGEYLQERLVELGLKEK